MKTKTKDSFSIIDATGKWFVDSLGKVREVIYKKNPTPTRKYREFLKDKLAKLRKWYS